MRGGGGRSSYCSAANILPSTNARWFVKVRESSDDAGDYDDVLLSSIMIFVESRGFSRRMGEFMDGDSYRALQNQLIADPTKGAVIPGCGGLRKVRVEDVGRSRGTRGGARVIYLNIPVVGRIDLVAICGKDETDDLSAAQRRILSALARQAKREASRMIGREQPK